MTSIPSTHPPTPDARFRQVVHTTIKVAVVIWIGSALLSAYLIGRYVEQEKWGQVERAVNALAANAVNAFMLDDAELAKAQADNLRSLDSFRDVVFLRADQSALYASHDFKPPYDGSRGEPTLWQDNGLLHAVAPVSARPGTSPFESSLSARGQRLGYVYIVADLRAVRTAQGYVFLIHALVLALSGLFLVGWFRQRLRMLETTVDLMTGHLRDAYQRSLVADRHKDEFMATVTHELRQPLTSIQGFTELALAELRFVPEAAAIGEHLGTVRQTATQMLTVVSQLLAYTKWAAGKDQLHYTVVDLRALIRRATTLVQPWLDEQGNELIVQLEMEQVVSDEDKLFHIVSNLLSNACKFTRNGRVSVTTFYRTDCLYLTVADTGIGIDAANQALIFEPFRQVDMTLSRTYRGTGMGLAIVKNYCELLGGSISVDSALGEGATFQVVVPCSAEKSGEVTAFHEL